MNVSSVQYIVSLKYIYWTSLYNRMYVQLAEPADVALTYPVCYAGNVSCLSSINH